MSTLLPGVLAIEDEGIDVLVRFHDKTRLDELERAIFSLVAQEYRPLRILLLLQRFSKEETDTLEAAIRPVLAWPNPPTLEILGFDKEEPEDARSELMNVGLRAVRSRYLAILDYDDVLFPEAYRLLIGRLRETQAAIVFAGIDVKLADAHPGFVYARKILQPFSGSTLSDLFRVNFCPIHSFIVDRLRAPAEQLYFEPSLVLQEDYDFLLRLCARVLADFGLLKTKVGEYFYKTDDSNSISRSRTPEPEVLIRAEAAAFFLEARRRITVLSPEIQRSLGIADPVANLTIRRFLDR